MFVLKNTQLVIATKREDIKDIVNAERLSFLCILISDQKNIKEKRVIKRTDNHIENDNLINTLRII